MKEAVRKNVVPDLGWLSCQPCSHAAVEMFPCRGAAWDETLGGPVLIHGTRWCSSHAAMLLEATRERDAVRALVSDAMKARILEGRNRARNFELGAKSMEATIAEAQRQSELQSEQAENMKASHDEQLLEAAHQLELARDEKESLIKELKGQQVWADEMAKAFHEERRLIYETGQAELKAHEEAQERVRSANKILSSELSQARANSEKALGQAEQELQFAEQNNAHLRRTHQEQSDAGVEMLSELASFKQEAESRRVELHQAKQLAERDLQTQGRQADSHMAHKLSQVEKQHREEMAMFETSANRQQQELLEAARNAVATLDRVVASEQFEKQSMENQFAQRLGEQRRESAEFEAR